MPTNEQSASGDEKRIQALKRECLSALKKFHAAKASGDPLQKQVELFDDWVGKSIELFNYVESCIASGDLLGANRSQFWAKEMANTASNLLDAIPDFYEKQWFEAGRLGQPVLKPSPNAFSAMQNAVKVYNSDQAENFKERFQKLNLPIRGFTHPANMNTMYDRWEKVAMLVTIIIFLGLLFAVGVFKRDWDIHGFYIIRTILAIFAAAFAAAAIPGVLEVTFNIRKSFGVRAVGAIGVFVIVYLVNPPNLVSNEKPELAVPAAR